MKQAFFIAAVLAIAIGGVVVFMVLRQEKVPDMPVVVIEETGNAFEKTELIRVNSPRPGDPISSPLVVYGEARGNWFFEASFPIKLLDGNGKEIAVAIAQAQEEWMTTNFVLFKATLEFLKPATANGTLVLEKDNPSGLPEHADSLLVPIRF